MYQESPLRIMPSQVPSLRKKSTCSGKKVDRRVIIHPLHCLIPTRVAGTYSMDPLERGCDNTRFLSALGESVANPYPPQWGGCRVAAGGARNVIALNSCIAFTRRQNPEIQKPISRLCLREVSPFFSQKMAFFA